MKNKNNIGNAIVRIFHLFSSIVIPRQGVEQISSTRWLWLQLTTFPFHKLKHRASQVHVTWRAALQGLSSVVFLFTKSHIVNLWSESCHLATLYCNIRSMLSFSSPPARTSYATQSMLNCFCSLSTHLIENQSETHTHKRTHAYSIIYYRTVYTVYLHIHTYSIIHYTELYILYIYTHTHLHTHL
jgi:hypothetical protein